MEIRIMCGISEKIRMEGRNEGIKEGIKKGRNEGMIQTLCDLVKDGILTISEAAKRADMTEKIFVENMEKFKA
jgi:Tfp pilus assembly pilus retraction ATPase PilT